MNNYTISVYVPKSTGTTTLTRENILDSKYLDNNQKQLLMSYLYSNDAITYKGDKYFKVAEGKKVTVSNTSVYYNPAKDKYVAFEKEEANAYFSTYKDREFVTKNSTNIKVW